MRFVCIEYIWLLFLFHKQYNMATLYVVFMLLYQLQAILDYMISNMHENMLIL